MQPYYYLVIPYPTDPRLVTQWHPPAPGGTLTRGAFEAVDEAHTWAFLHIPGSEYRVVRAGNGVHQEVAAFRA